MSPTQRSLRAVFRLGVITLEPGSVRIQNRTTDMLTGLPFDRTLALDAAGYERWRAWLLRRLRERQG